MSPRRILGAMLQSRLGLSPKPSQLTLTLGKTETLGSIFHGEEDLSPDNITRVLQERYHEEFQP